MIRFLLLHAKSDGDDQINAYVAQARSALEPHSNGKAFEIVPGRDQFERRFKACGSWESWATECGSGVDQVTRVPNFAGYLVPWDSSRSAQACLFVGAGTVKIVEAALGSRRLVMVFRGDSKTAKVKRLRVVDPKNYQQGFAIDHEDWR